MRVGSFGPLVGDTGFCGDGSGGGGGWPKLPSEEEQTRLDSPDRYLTCATSVASGTRVLLRLRRNQLVSHVTVRLSLSLPFCGFITGQHKGHVHVCIVSHIYCVYSPAVLFLGAFHNLFLFAALEICQVGIFRSGDWNHLAWGPLGKWLFAFYIYVLWHPHMHSWDECALQSDECVNECLCFSVCVCVCVCVCACVCVFVLFNHHASNWREGGYWCLRQTDCFLIPWKLYWQNPAQRVYNSHFLQVCEQLHR